MLIVALLAVATSIVTLVLTLSNFEIAKSGVEVSYLALDRVLSVGTARVMVRALFNQAQGNIDRYSELLPSRS